MRPIAITSTSPPLSSSTVTAQQQPAPQKSPWHSPVPYLFGGLAAMLGLIAFALLILACSYWRLANQEEEEERDLESGQKDAAAKQKQPKVYEDKILVIMAGQEKPTFLATPVSTSKAISSFNNHTHGETDNTEEEKFESVQDRVKTVLGVGEETETETDHHPHQQERIPIPDEEEEH